MIEWMQGNIYTMQATVYENNLTLNNFATSKLKKYRWCMLGFDFAHKKLAIMGIEQKDVDNKSIPQENLNRISIGKSYARISNKYLIEKINEVIGYNGINKKFNCYYDDGEKILYVDLGDPL